MRARILMLLMLWLAGLHAAEAHAILEKAVPPVGGSVAAAPPELRLRFSQPLDPALSQITLSTKDGAAIALGPLALDPQDGHTLVATVSGSLAPGSYTVRWQAVSPDSHRTTGDFTFQVGR